jgi:hypothetical protein
VWSSCRVELRGVSVDYSDRALVVASIITQVGGFLAVWIKARSAERLSKPTGNGFAKMVEDALTRIEGKVDRHIESHSHSREEKQERRGRRW